MSRQKRVSPPVEQRLVAVLAVLSGEATMADIARRHNVNPATVAKWRDRFLEAGRLALMDDKLTGPVSSETMKERRLRLESEQLKLALAEATVQLRIWQRGADYIDEIPSKTSRR